jgi:hypothetical protein
MIYELANIIGVVSGIILIIILFFWVFVFNPTIRFHNECQKLEKDIKINDNQERQKQKLIKLCSYSVHRKTSNRIEELALMLEKKYDIVVDI